MSCQSGALCWPPGMDQTWFVRGQLWSSPPPVQHFQMFSSVLQEDRQLFSCSSASKLLQSKFLLSICTCVSAFLPPPETPLALLAQPLLLGSSQKWVVLMPSPKAGSLPENQWQCLQVCRCLILISKLLLKKIVSSPVLIQLFQCSMIFSLSSVKMPR